MKQKENKCQEVVDEQLPVGHRSPSAGSDSTDSYAKMQDAKRKAKAAGDKEDNWQKYHEEVEVDETRSPTLVTTRTVLKPSLKGMSKKAKAILRFKDNQAKRIQNKDNRAPGEDLIK